MRLPLPFGAYLRLHIWPAERQEMNLPHDHRWSFLSIPVWGTFRDTRYREAPAGPVYGVFEARHLEASRSGKLPATGQTVRLAAVTCVIRKPLRPYRVRRSEIHTFVPATAGRAATVVLVGRARSDRSRVFAEEH